MGILPTSGEKASEGRVRDGHYHWSWGHRWSNTERLDLRLERKLGWNEGGLAGYQDGSQWAGYLRRSW